MFNRFITYFALIFTFALAQIGAATHEISHINDYAKHGTNQNSQSKQSDKQADQHKLTEQCAQCIAFAQLAGGLQSQTFVMPVTLSGIIGNSDKLFNATSHFNSAYLARAPPQTNQL